MTHFLRSKAQQADIKLIQVNSLNFLSMLLLTDNFLLMHPVHPII